MPRFGAQTARQLGAITTKLLATLALTAVLIPTTTAPASTAQARDAGQSIANSDRGVIPAIAAGGSHTCALDNTGQISCWGNGSNGQLGTGNTNQLNTPSAPIALPAGTTATAITAGSLHTCALLNTGQISCWGYGGGGQLGTGNTNTLNAPSDPIALPADTTATAITTGNAHTCALLNTGQISCWGTGGNGQLGTGNNSSRNTPSDPIALPADTTATAITTGSLHTCALLNTAQISCWGLGGNGQLGTGNTNTLNAPSDPIALPAGTTATAITAGGSHTCALLNTAQISCWGNGSNGRLGTGNTNTLNAPSDPITLPAGTTATAITTGGAHTCALLNTGQISCWGSGGNGRLGTGNTNDLDTPSDPIDLPAGTTATAITTGSSHTCALLNTGQISCWGNGSSGRLGTGNTNQLNTPSAPIALPSVDPLRQTAATAAGDLHTCALVNTGQISCWGTGSNGRLGTGNTNNLNTPSAPITLPADTTATAITTGSAHTCALLNTAQISCWGFGGNGQLGTGNTNSLNTPSAPITLPAGTTATAITAGSLHTCALLNTAQISCWGQGSNGRLGTGNTNNLNTPSAPIALPAGTTATAITTGGAHTCALLNTGQISCWGHGSNGQLGTGNNNQLNTPSAPITLPAGTTATAITTGSLHTCALLNTGNITCWGFGSNGQLGTGNTNQLNTPSAPIALPAGTTATAITAGNSHTCALLNTGNITCWGRQNEGQLGNGSSAIASITTPPNPITLPAGTTATAITASNSHTCALLNTAQISCWGTGSNGRLGTGNNNEQPLPTLVTFPQTTPTLALATGQTNPTNTTTINITATFDQPVTLTAADITVAGTAGGTTATPTGTGTTWNIAITGMTNNGTITITIPEGTVSAYGNTASNTLTVDYDTTGPIATIDLAPNQNAATTTTPIVYTVTFDEPVTGFDSNDITLGGTAGATITDTVITGSGTDYTVTINRVADPGTIIVGVDAAAVTDALGNPSTTVIVDNTVTINDTTAPIIVVPADIAVDTEPDATFATVTYTVTATDPNSNGTTTSNSAANFAGTVTIDCTPPSGSQFPIGTTTVTCTATDTTGNTNTATFTITVNAITTTTTSTTTTSTTTTTIAPTTTTTTPATTPATTTAPATTSAPPTTAPPPSIDPNIVLPATGNSSQQLTNTLLIGLLLTLGGITGTLVTRRRP